MIQHFIHSSVKEKDKILYYLAWYTFKNMGKDMEVVVDVANVQRNFYMADKIIVSNEHTKDVLVDSHNLKISILVK